MREGRGEGVCVCVKQLALIITLNVTVSSFGNAVSEQGSPCDAL